MKCIVAVLCFVFISCDNNVAFNKSVISVSDHVNIHYLLNLSDYADSITYIPLETTGAVLLSDIKQIAYENELIVLLDKNNHCEIYDKQGVYKKGLAAVGNGPNEFVYLNSFDLNPQSHRILLKGGPNRSLIYDYEGNICGRISYPEPLYNIVVNDIVFFNNDTFYVDVASWDDFYFKGFLFVSNDTIADILVEYPNFISRKKERKGYSLSFENGLVYRFNNEIKTYKSINDTLFVLGDDLKMYDEYVFDFGRYKLPTKLIFEDGNDSLINYIWVTNIQESSRYLFLDLFFGNHAPEPFEYLKYFPDGSTALCTNYNVCAIYDKETYTLKYLSQPIKSKFGFFNDIDNGPAVWPKYISSENLLITYCSVEEFMECYDNIEKPSARMKEIADNLNLDDNPIVIIAHFK